MRQRAREDGGVTGSKRARNKTKQKQMGEKIQQRMAVVDICVFCDGFLMVVFVLILL